MWANLCCMFFGVLFSLCVIVYALILAVENVENGQVAPKTIPGGPRASSTLKFLVVISRHGNRRLMGFPNDPYPINDTSYWPYVAGELTTHGRIQMYRLGEKIRSLYDGYLNRDYGVDEIQASSTVISRVVMSGEVFLAGLYPPHGVYIWNEKIPWQPVPIYSDSLDKSDAVMECQRFLQEKEVSLAKFCLDNAMQLEAIGLYLSKYSGNYSFSDSSSFFSIWDSLLSEDIEGYDLPKWSKEVYPVPMEDLAAKRFISIFGVSDHTVRLILGQFTRQIMGVMKSKLNGTLSPDKKMYYYSAHDTSLLGLQLVLGIPRSEVIAMPNPGSAMMFELHQNPNSSVYTVQVLYIDGRSSNLEPIFLTIPECPHPCEFAKFVEITSKFENVTDFDEECQS